MQVIVPTNQLQRNTKRGTPNWRFTRIHLPLSRILQPTNGRNKLKVTITNQISQDKKW